VDISIPKKSQQPNSLYLLFFTELWERFGFYTLQTILILYMSKALLYSDHKSYLMYATFSALLYLLPVVGGYVADKYLGYTRAIFIGGLLFIISYLITSLPGERVFFFGLSVLICAHGPNVSSLVGSLYDEDDPRREGGFTLFYMGINIGALVPPLIAGYIVRHLGWHVGFLLAAVGMMISMIVFVVGKKMLGSHGAIPKHSPILKGGLPNLKFQVLFYFGILMCILLANIAFQYPLITKEILEGVGVGVLLVVLAFAYREAPAARNKMLAALVLIIISVGFWAIYNQTYTSLMLYAARNMHHEIFGISIDAESTQFFNPLFIILFSPVLSQLWTRLSFQKKNLSIPLKFALGVLLVSLGFFVLVIGTKYFSHNGITSAWWLVLSYMVQTIGELLLSPIGLAMIAELSPKKLVGMMMGVWFFSNSVSSVISGTLASYTDVPKSASVVQANAIYSHGFWVFSMIALVLAIVTFALIPFLNRMIGSRKPVSTA